MTLSSCPTASISIARLLNDIIGNISLKSSAKCAPSLCTDQANMKYILSLFTCEYSTRQENCYSNVQWRVRYHFEQLCGSESIMHSTYNVVNIIQCMVTNTL